MRLHAIPHSTNVHRVLLALALKHAPDAVELVEHDPRDRRAIVALSGQELVPVLETDDGAVLTDSMPIVRWVEDRYAGRAVALWPPDLAPQIDGIVAFFNHVWKLPPNAIDAERRSTTPDPAKIAAWTAQVRAWQHGFEALLTNRPYLLSDDAPTAADVCAFPFLRFTAGRADPDDDDRFHGVLLELLPGPFPNLHAWIDRLSERNRPA